MRDDVVCSSNSRPVRRRLGEEPARRIGVLHAAKTLVDDALRRARILFRTPPRISVYFSVMCGQTIVGLPRRPGQ